MDNSTTHFIKSTLAAKQWEHIGINHHHGICLPLFSLRTEKSCGIGEYLDLLPIVQWCSEIGLDIIQLLPLNDNGTGSSPYSGLSAFALNPVHLSLHALSGWEAIPELKDFYNALQKLNAEQRVDYSNVFPLKELFLKKYFSVTITNIKNSKEYRDFKSSCSWLEKYSLFKALKIEKNWIAWTDWPEEWKNPSEEQYKTLLNRYAKEVEYHTFVQYHCFQQLIQVRQEAKKHGIFLKGDIPILFSKDCADVWANKRLFELNFSAGAPPDMFNSEGQDWGFPLYNWEQIEREHYDWWIQRLKTAAQFYNLYRLDHIVGFYRIWAINLELPNLPKGFVPPNPESWIPHGEKIMKTLIPSSEMLPIGEDLGVVPPVVRQNLRSLGICGTKVMRWERRWNEDKKFIPFTDYEPLSMTTVSTHDSETLQLWWSACPEEAKEFALFKGWEYTPEPSVAQHRQILYDSHHTASLFHINLLQEYLALLPGKTWKNPEDERINIPGVISDKNWSYKFRPSVEEIIADDTLKQIMKKMITPA